MEYRDLIVKKEGGVATVTLNRPQALNALSMEIREGLGTLFQEFRTDDSVRVVVLTGAGRAFSAGGDVKAMTEFRPPMAAKDFIRNMIHRAVLAITTLEKPVIAMVNGVATGAGCAIALMCDLVIAAESARFGFAFVRIGLGPDWGGAYFPTKLIGPHRAKELLFTGKLISAREAERIGLINQVVPDDQLQSATMELARQLAKGAPKAIGTAKTMINIATNADLLTYLEYEANTAALMLQSEDHKEGVKAFMEKREANFQGK